MGKTVVEEMTLAERVARLERQVENLRKSSIGRGLDDLAAGKFRPLSQAKRDALGRKCVRCGEGFWPGCALAYDDDRNVVHAKCPPAATFDGDADLGDEDDA